MGGPDRRAVGFGGHGERAFLYRGCEERRAGVHYGYNGRTRKGHAMRRYMTTPEVARALGVSRMTVHRWAVQDRGPVRPVAKAGRDFLWSPMDVQWAQARSA